MPRTVVCSVSCPLATGKSTCVEAECVGKRKLEAALLQYFKFSSFRPGQLESLLPLLHGKDVFVRMATGGGKTLCLFLAPLAIGEKAIGVTISPLSALMDQQVNILTGIGVTAVHVGVHTNFDDVISGKFQFVFMAPETAVSPPWRNVFSFPLFQERLVVIAVDEAHCIFEWGSNFRNSFEKIGGLRALTDVPIIAVTATAPKAVKSMICDSLSLQEPVVVSQPLDRPNIFLSCTKSRGMNSDMAGIISCLKGAKEPKNIPKTLVFCRTKEVAVNMYRLLLQSSSRRDYVSMFHASLTKATKQAIQNNFLSPTSALRCLVATVAFGMGMDIPDIELVVVHGIPDTLAQFYQLCGRAGRNGCHSRAHLFITKRKVSDSILEQYSASSNTENCLREIMLKGLESSGVVTHSSTCCQVCSCGIIPYERLDILKPGIRQYRRKPPPVRCISDDMMKELEAKLYQERSQFLNEKPCYRIFGPQCICCDSVIKELCSKAKYIADIEDLSSVKLLRPELRSRFFDVIMSTVGNEPPAKRRRK